MEGQPFQVLLILHMRSKKRQTNLFCAHFLCLCGSVSVCLFYFYMFNMFVSHIFINLSYSYIFSGYKFAVIGYKFAAIGNKFAALNYKFAAIGNKFAAIATNLLFHVLLSYELLGSQPACGSKAQAVQQICSPSIMFWLK